MDRVQLFKRGETWWVRFTLDGKQRRQSLDTNNRKIAEDLRAQKEAKLRSRELKLPRDVPTRACLDRYLAHQKARKTEKGYITDRCYLERFFKAVPVTKLNDLTSAAVCDYLVARKEAGRSAKTLNRIRECVHTLFSWAMDQGLLYENPVKRVKRFPEPPHTIRFIRTLEDIEAFLKVFEGHRLQPLVAIYIFAGVVAHVA